MGRGDGEYEVVLLGNPCNWRWMRSIVMGSHGVERDGSLEGSERDGCDEREEI
jgi:hypothetical protein